MEFDEAYGALQELHNATGALADYLLEAVKLKKGDRVLLVFFPCLDFTISLLACFRAGLIAVPVFPPDPRKLKKDLHHFMNIQENSNAKVALTNAQYNFVKKVEDIKHLFSSVKWPELRWVPVDDQLKRGRTKPAGPAPKLEGDGIAFLQYTSGSTSEPKGVMISHNNLAHNLTLITRELRADQTTVNVSWLPQFHDMGLIGSYLGILYCGGQGYYMSPVSFIRDPVIWLRTISRFSGTHTQSPSFGYALTARKFREGMESSPAAPVSLDLSSLRHMINAAEPVNYKEMLDFYDTFQPYQLPNNVVGKNTCPLHGEVEGEEIQETSVCCQNQCQSTIYFVHVHARLYISFLVSANLLNCRCAGGRSENVTASFLMRLLLFSVCHCSSYIWTG